MEPLRIGIVGVGNISGIYFKNLGAYQGTEIIAVADLDLARATEVAEREGIAQALTPEKLINHPDVELVLNLTIPKAHVPVALQAVEARKHVYSEKPLGVNFAEGQALIAAAAKAGVRVGCAPDTFMGGGIQTARQLIDDGAIGEPLAAQAFMLCHGHETWHPSPEFYYEVGGGPMMDMGPYYMTALVNLLGPIRRVTGSARASFPTRTITSQPKHGKVVTVETPTHISGVFDFESGVIAQITTSFDVYGGQFPPITIYGSAGSILVPDPNGFGGEVKVCGPNGKYEAVPLSRGFADNDRGVGVLDMANAIRNGGEHRASGDLALHVLEGMLAFNASSESGQHYQMTTPVTRPEAMPDGVFAGIAG